MTHKLVRLKSYDPKRGFMLRRLTVRGVTFKAGAGWYRVRSEIATYLEGVTQRPRDEHSPNAFDVKSETEARALEEKEEIEAREKKTTVEAPTVEARPSPDDSKSRRGRSSKRETSASAKEDGAS
jgi:hypothetical protein